MRDAWRRPAPCDRHRCMLHNEWCFICSVHVTCHDYVPACLLQLVWYYFDCWILYSSANHFIQWIYCASIVCCEMWYSCVVLTSCCWLLPDLCSPHCSATDTCTSYYQLVYKRWTFSAMFRVSLTSVDNTEKQTTREMEKTWSLNRVLVRYQSLPEFTGLCNAPYHCHIVD